FGPKTENSRGSKSSFPDPARITFAVARVCPAFRSARRSWLFGSCVSASSISSVGVYWSIVRKRAGGVIEEAESGRRTSAPITRTAVVLPHRFEGELKLSNGAMSEASEQYVDTVHRAAASAAPGGSTTYRDSVSATRSRRVAPSTS